MSIRRRRPEGLTVVTLAVYLGFAVALGLKIARAAPFPAELVVALAALALAGTLRFAYRTVSLGLRGPEGRPAEGEGLVCAGAVAEAVRAAALRRDEAGGGGVLRRWGLVFPILAQVGLAVVFVSGLLNATRYIEGRWVQFEGAGKDLDRRDTYEELQTGLFADPAELEYGVVLGRVRPTEPDRLYSLRVLNPGGVLREGSFGLRESVHLGDLTLYQWAIGPGVRLTVVHEERGRLLDRPLVLWPSRTRPETFLESLVAEDLQLQVQVEGWPPAAGEPPRVGITLRQDDGQQVRTLLDLAQVEPRSVNQGEEGYAVIVWEVRPYVGFGLVRGTYLRLTQTGLLALLLGLLGWAAVRPRAFAYRETGEGVQVWPPSAGARLGGGAKQ